MPVSRSGAKRLPQFVNELDRDGREIVDEIERVLDLIVRSRRALDPANLCEAVREAG